MCQINSDQIVLVDGQQYEIEKNLSLVGNVFQVKNLNTDKK